MQRACITLSRYESYDAKSEALTSGQRVRITAASVVNLNVTSAGLDTWLGAFSAWQKQAAFEQQARRAADLVTTKFGLLLRS